MLEGSRKMGRRRTSGFVSTDTKATLFPAFLGFPKEARKCKRLQGLYSLKTEICTRSPESCVYSLI